MSSWELSACQITGGLPKLGRGSRGCRCVWVIIEWRQCWRAWATRAGKLVSGLEIPGSVYSKAAGCVRCSSLPFSLVIPMAMLNLHGRCRLAGLKVATERSDLTCSIKIWQAWWLGDPWSCEKECGLSVPGFISFPLLAPVFVHASLKSEANASLGVTPLFFYKCTY